MTTTGTIRGCVYGAYRHLVDGGHLPIGHDRAQVVDRLEGIYRGLPDKVPGTPTLVERLLERWQP